MSARQFYYQRSSRDWEIGDPSPRRMEAFFRDLDTYITATLAAEREAAQEKIDELQQSLRLIYTREKTLVDHERARARPVIEAARKLIEAETECGKTAFTTPDYVIACSEYTKAQMRLHDAIIAYDATHPQDRASPGETEADNG